MSYTIALDVPTLTLREIDTLIEDIRENVEISYSSAKGMLFVCGNSWELALVITRIELGNFDAPCVERNPDKLFNIIQPYLA